MASGIARGWVRTARAGNGVAQHGGHTPKEVDRDKAFVYSVLLLYWTSMQQLIDTCQNRVSAGQYHMAISQAQVYSSSKSHFFFKLTAEQLLV